MKKNIEYEIGSGNVFADLGLANPEERLAKAKLAIQINDLIKEKNLTQKNAAKLLDIDQPKVSDLSRGRLSGFSLDRLLRFLNILGQDVTIKITPKKVTRRKAELNIIMPKIKKTPVINRKTSTDALPMHAKKRSSNR
ncbi:MAG: helix-turn-helix transcriptional regulator [Candidatus Babeliales bacterium]|nr:helix-turn-helix transcriptional regulator [Candidatus Babeliales bacterium]